MNKILALQDLAPQNGPDEGETNITSQITSALSMTNRCTSTID
ncbi:class III lanthipeptide [Streptomyces sp. NPDC092952]